MTQANANAGSDGFPSRWVTFEIDSQCYGIDVGRVQEVLRVPPITPVPGAAHDVLGVINLRGNIVTVRDLRGRLGLPEGASDDAQRVVIVGEAESATGWRVDRVFDVMATGPSGAEAPPRVGASHPCVSALARRNGGIVQLLDALRLQAVGQD